MMQRVRTLGMIAVAVLLVVLIFGFRFRQLGQDTALASVRSVQSEQGVPVETVAVVRDDLERWLTLAGTVEGRVQYPVVSNNALRVVGLPVAEGDHVEAGDVVVRLASEAPSPMYHSVDQARARYQQALTDVRRLRNLLREGAISQAELDAAETTLEVLAADLQNAEGSTVLTASESGVVARILITEGQTARAGAPLVWIINTDEVLVKFTAGSRQALRLAEGQPTRWIAPDGQPWSGQLSHLDLMANPVSHLLGGEVRFTNPGGLLVPGLLVSFDVRTDLRQDTLLLPAGCLVDHDGQDAVWVAGDTATLTPVTVGLRGTDQVEVLAGVQEGSPVVRHGQTLLTDGVKIKAVADMGGR